MHSLARPHIQPCSNSHLHCTTQEKTNSIPFIPSSCFRSVLNCCEYTYLHTHFLPLSHTIYQ
ncbi:hypothetical protein BDZ45DRAFT_271527 [Acephala macrosclerotiorum]|nr:hypothetical protein BDZ45DRAFT_271527 [Acephala macrosclerotiorum]